MDARRGARHVPAAAASGHAVRHRGDLGRAAASRRRPGAAHRGPLAVAGARDERWSRPTSGRGSSSCVASATHAPRRASSLRRGCRWTWSCPRRLATAFEALRPAIERLARARPLTAHPSADALRAAGGEGGLAVIAGDIEAVIGRPRADEASEELDRARLEREFEAASRLLEAARGRLANEEFMAKAPAAVVEGARRRAAELEDQVERLRERLLAPMPRGRGPPTAATIRCDDRRTVPCRLSF